MKKNSVSKHFFNVGIGISCFLLVAACTPQKKAVTKIKGNYIEINQNIIDNTAIDSFLTPYRNHIEKDLSKVLAYNPYDLDRTEAKWQNKMTNFYADAILEQGNFIFEKRYGKKIDFCMLNYGGIRATIPKGSVTTRTAFDIMPFENSAIVLGLKGSAVYEMAQYILTNKVAHPLSGIEIIVKNDTIKDIKINQKSIDKNTIYYVVTNDYLAKGGDNMTFFLKAQTSYPLDYKLRNMFINYFTAKDTLTPSTQPRIIFE